MMIVAKQQMAPALIIGDTVPVILPGNKQQLTVAVQHDAVLTVLLA